MEYIYPIVVLISALLASIAVVASLAGLLHISNIFGTRIILGSILAISVLIAAAVILGGRDLTHVGESITNLYNQEGGAGSFIVKILNWLLILLLVGVLLDRLISLRHAKNRTNIRLGWLLLFVLYVVSNGIIGAFFGTNPNFVPGLLYPLILLVILAIDSNWSIREVLYSIKTGAFIVLSLGIVLLLTRPSMVLEGGSSGAMAIIKFRYWGATPHANALGSIAVLYILLEILCPSKNTKWRVIGMVVGIISIVLSQSKTAILGILLSMGCIWIIPSRAVAGNRPIRSDVLVTLKIISIMLLPMLLYIILLFSGYESKIDKVMASDTGKSVTTLTGRTQIWDAALREWKDNPVFGYGPDLFNVEHRMRIGMNFAFHAHNQVIQTLAQSGLVGLVGLIVFLGLLAGKLLSRSVASRGVSLALFAFLLVRCVTEVPLRSGNMVSGEYLYMLALVAIAMSSSSSIEELSSKVMVTSTG